MLKQIHSERFSPLIGGNRLCGLSEAFKSVLTAVGCSRCGGLAHERKVIIQIMGFLRLRETSRALYVISLSTVHLVPHGLCSLSYQNAPYTLS